MIKILLLFPLCILSAPSIAQDGVLDSSFGTNGTVITSLGELDRGHRIAVQSDGKLLVTAFHQNTPGMLALLRYNLDGSLDESFNSDGIVTLPFTVTAQSTSTENHCITLQDDGKILVSGDSQGNTTIDFTVFRFNNNGSLDTDFDTDGKVQINFGPFNSSSATSMQLQTDGKIVLGGYTTLSGATDFAVARLNTDGSLDTDFDTDGKAVIPVGEFVDRAYAMAIQDDGNIVLAGSALGNLITDFALIRINSDGSLDLDFGIDGKVITPFDTHGNQLNAIRIHSDGKIVATGNSYGTLNGGYSYNFSLLQYLPDGNLDADFGADGKVLTNVGSSNDNDFSNALLIQPDGRIIVGGTSYGLPGPQFAAARYTNTGILDDTFGEQGLAITPIENGAFGSDVVLQNDGKLILLGYSVNFNSNATSIALARYTTGVVIGIPERTAFNRAIQVYPNPAKELLQVTFSLAKAAPIDFILTDAKGKRVAELAKGLAFGSGDHTHTLRLPADLPQGIYYLTMHLLDSIEVMRVAIY